MPVITGQGLIGRVQQVSEGRAVVQLITDTTLKVGFSVVGTPIIGITEGTGRSRELTGSVDLDSAVAPGQIVVTSGIGESPYPADIPIGTIASVEEDEAARVKHLRITPFEDLSDLTFASVVLYQP
jgi:rod shape-determining protein MreC